MTPTGRIGATGCAASIWLSDSGVLCLIPGGAKTGADAAVTIQTMETSFTLSFTYDQPSLSRVRPSNAPTGGGEFSNYTITVFGSGIGNFQSSARVRVLGTSCEASEWLADSSLRCLSSSGVGSNNGVGDLAVTVFTRFSTLSAAFTYNRPYVTHISQTCGPSTGGFAAVFSGNFFGMADYTPVGYVDYDACHSTTWTSDTSLVCVFPEGYGIGRGVAVEVGDEYGPPYYDDFIFAFKSFDILTVYGLPNSEHQFLALWLKADALELSEGEDVTSWNDSSSEGTPVEILGTPTFCPRALNDLPSVQLNATMMQAIRVASNASDAVAQAFGNGPILSKKFTVFLVLRARSNFPSGRQSYFSAGSTQTADDLYDFSL
eukprot:3105664-Rhodomonas_salina.1